LNIDEACDLTAASPDWWCFCHENEKRHHSILNNMSISNAITYKLKIPRLRHDYQIRERNKDSQTAGRGSIAFSWKIAETMKHTC
jgi:hypothetical protein